MIFFIYPPLLLINLFIDFPISRGSRCFTIASVIACVIYRILYKFTSIFSKNAMICFPNNVAVLSLWSYVLSLNVDFNLSFTPWLIISEKRRNGLGMQNDIIVLNGSSSVYYFLRKLIPQKIKLKRNPNSFWQAV